jgi:hypothetical protein
MNKRERRSGDTIPWQDIHITTQRRITILPNGKHITTSNFSAQHLLADNTKTRLWAPGLRRGGEEIVNSLSAPRIHRIAT